MKIAFVGTGYLGLANAVLSRKPEVVGIDRLVIKEGSDNIRASAMQGVMKHLKAKGVQVIAYGPSMEEKHFSHSELLDDLASFKGCRDVLIANRQHAGLDDVAHKDYTRGLFSDDAWCLEFQSIIIRPAE